MVLHGKVTANTVAYIKAVFWVVREISEWQYSPAAKFLGGNWAQGPDLGM
jgi:hypothetical protein